MVNVPGKERYTGDTGYCPYCEPALMALLGCRETMQYSKFAMFVADHNNTHLAYLSKLYQDRKKYNIKDAVIVFNGMKQKGLGECIWQLG